MSQGRRRGSPQLLHMLFPNPTTRREKCNDHARPRLTARTPPAPQSVPVAPDSVEEIGKTEPVSEEEWSVTDRDSEMPPCLHFSSAPRSQLFILFYRMRMPQSLFSRQRGDAECTVFPSMSASEGAALAERCPAFRAQSPEPSAGISVHTWQLGGGLRSGWFWGGVHRFSAGSTRTDATATGPVTHLPQAPRPSFSRPGAHSSADTEGTQLCQARQLALGQEDTVGTGGHTPVCCVRAEGPA